MVSEHDDAHPSRSWCDHAGKSHEDSHPLREAKKCRGEVPRFGMGYWVFGQGAEGRFAQNRGGPQGLKEPVDSEDGAVPASVVVDRKTGATFSSVVTKDVNNYYVVHTVVALSSRGGKRSSSCQMGNLLSGHWSMLWPKKQGQKCKCSTRQRNRTAGQIAQQKEPSLRWPGKHTRWCALKTEGEVYPWVVRRSGWLIALPSQN